MFFLIIIFVFIHNWKTCQSIEHHYQLDLGGEWRLDQEPSGNLSDLRAYVPGGIYTDLMENRIIPDVFAGFNDVETRWVAKSNWTYRRNFTLDNKLESMDHLYLVLDGVDTIATIRLNNNTIGTTQNMFVQYRFPIKNVLKFNGETNTLSISLASPIQMANQSAEEFVRTYNYSIVPNCPPAPYHGECHINQLRKQQASFGWDWGPALPSSGIWQPIYLEAYNTSRIQNRLINIAPDTTDDYWLINITTFLTDPIPSGVTIYLTHSLSVNGRLIKDIFHLESGSSQVTNQFLRVPQLMVKLWWPNGYGSQPLYPLTTELLIDGVVYSYHIRKIGFRTIELIQTPHMLSENATGYNFYFQVNGVPIFAKGTNLVPRHLLPNQSPEPDRLLNAAKWAGMNMLRVWGGGIYESDRFYDLADQLGLMIWQDFMFACAMYPATSTFKRNVLDEVDYQVGRLHHHPSIVLWAGNNENEAALMQNWYGSTSTTDHPYLKDYIELYVNTIRGRFEQLQTNTIFVTSSPSNGRGTDPGQYVSKDPEDPNLGDIHYYNYVIDGFNTDLLPKSRFVSEFGFQSLPNFNTWLNASVKVKDLIWNSKFVQHRQHLLDGNDLIQALMNFQLDVPCNEDFRLFIYYSQIIQAMAVKTQVEFYRSQMGRIFEANTMGALYWQFNDVWVAPSWSAIDYMGRWKMLQYFSRHFYSPILVTAQLTVTGVCNVYLIVDHFAPLGFDTSNSFTLYTHLYRYGGPFKPVSTSVTFPIQIKFGQSTAVLRIDQYKQFLDQFPDCAIGRNNGTSRPLCLLHMELRSKTSSVVAENFLFFGKLKDKQILNVTPKVTIEDVEQSVEDLRRFSVKVRANVVVLFVWLETWVMGRFSDNGFVQLRDVVTIEFLADSSIHLDDLRTSIFVRFV